MSNAATALTALPVKLYGSTKVTPIVCTFDTISTDLTVYTPGSGKFAAIVGWQYAEATAHNLTVTSGTTALATFEIPASSGRDDKIGQGVVICTNPGEALKIQVSAAVSYMVVYIVETDRLYFDS
jgi:hypothetical protein